MPSRTTVENFTRTESDRMFQKLATDAGSTGRWAHYRDVSPIDHQNIIRQNRDTLYSAAIVDISGGATLTVPETDGRYLSVMVINQDHFINRVFHEPGAHELTISEFDTEYVLLGARVFVDPAEPSDVAVARATQDGLGLRAAARRAFPAPVYDEASFTTTRDALLVLARGLGSFDRAFGRRSRVDPVRHLLATAAAWGGLPETEAFYANVDPGLPVAEHTLTMPADVPVDAFWSVSVYNADGYFEPNEMGAYSINSTTAEYAPDGSATISFGPGTRRIANRLPITEGWNYMVRLYRPRPEVLDGRWTVPTVDG